MEVSMGYIVQIVYNKKKIADGHLVGPFVMEEHAHSWLSSKGFKLSGITRIPWVLKKDRDGRKVNAWARISPMFSKNLII